MAIAVNNAVGGSSDTSPISYNAGTGSGRILVVVVSIVFADTEDINGVTYNASALTELDSQDDPWTWARVKVYYHLSPAEGANNIAISTDDNSYSAYAACYVSGADTSGVGTPASTNGEAVAQSISVTPVASGNILIGGFMHNDDDYTYSAGASTTLEVQAGNWARIGLASRSTTSTDAHALNLTASGSDGYGVIGFEIKADTGAVKDPIGGFGVIPFVR